MSQQGPLAICKATVLRYPTGAMSVGLKSPEVDAQWHYRDIPFAAAQSGRRRWVGASYGV